MSIWTSLFKDLKTVLCFLFINHETRIFTQQFWSVFNAVATARIRCVLLHILFLLLIFQLMTHKDSLVVCVWYRWRCTSLYRVLMRFSLVIMISRFPSLQIMLVNGDSMFWWSHKEFIAICNQPLGIMLYFTKRESRMWLCVCLNKVTAHFIF